jgi:hypothetical protein
MVFFAGMLELPASFQKSRRIRQDHCSAPSSGCFGELIHNP